MHTQKEKVLIAIAGEARRTWRWHLNPSPTRLLGRSNPSCCLKNYRQLAKLCRTTVTIIYQNTLGARAICDCQHALDAIP